MDESIQQVPGVTSSDTSNSFLLQAEDQQQQQQHKQGQQQHRVENGATAAISREAGDKLESQSRAISLATVIIDPVTGEKSQDHRALQDTINQQMRLSQHPSVAEQTDKPVPPSAGDQNPSILLDQQSEQQHESPVKSVLVEVESGAGSNNSANARPKLAAARSSTKANGLKNRQRPPPLVLDKVSNFYDNITNSSIVHPQRSQSQQPSGNFETQPSGIIDKQLSTSNKSDYSSLQPKANNYEIKQQQQQRPATDPNQLDDAFNTEDRTNNNNANNSNLKFWASLNENASRNKALSNARSISAAAAAAVATTTTLSEPPYAIGDSVPNLLGPDLVIKQRNSSGNISSSRVISTVSARRQHQQQQRCDQNKPNNETSRDTAGDQLLSNQYGLQFDEPESVRDAAYQRDALNHSDDLEECLVLADNNAGGNLIGVENITPPVTGSRDQQGHRGQQQSDEPPASATSSRPRSNNPFLDDNDEDFEEYRNSIRSQSANRDSFSSQENNFQKRPASFIAATDRITGFMKPSSDFAAKQRIVEEKLSELQFGDQSGKQQLTSSEPIEFMNRQRDLDSQAPQPPDQIDSQSLYQPTRVVQHQHQHIMAHHGAGNGVVYDPNHGQFVGEIAEPKISSDSASAVCQPPPSATMQLSHWSEAVYELNNAILETSSIAGGAENGQFIHIIESGDIILELDQVNVSGFTLLEFNELAESKQFHLLKAIQTKHSHGLMLSLKDYLAMSFPKNSKDKKLQSVVRDNIYRQTIPCTTRPPKNGEVNKIDYHFLTKEQFMELNKQGALIECGVYVGHYYGTLKPLCDIDKYLMNLSQEPQLDAYQVKMRRAWDASHPAVEMIMRKDAAVAQSTNVNDELPLYENHESLGLQQAHRDTYLPTMPINNPAQTAGTINRLTSDDQDDEIRSARINLCLPAGWERVTDQVHGTYYIDHNTRRTQYEQPYEVELTKSSMGFGFTLVEADSGLLLVRSVIPGGPAHSNGLIRPGDLLISAVGVLVTGLQHTDIARLFSTFAVGDRVRLTFAKSNYVLVENLIPDEYLFSNGTNGDLAIAVNPHNLQLDHHTAQSNPHIQVNQEFDFIKVTLKRGDQGFGFTISDSIAGQKVRKIQNHEICSNLKQGDILINLNNQDITKMTHKEVVERLKQCPPGADITLTIKRKRRFRSKTPMALHTDASGEFSLDGTPQRNCKTPSLDVLMLRQPISGHEADEPPAVSHNLFQSLNQGQDHEQAQQQQQQQLQLMQGTSPRDPSANVANGLPTAALSNSLQQQSYGLLGPQSTNGTKLSYDESMFITQQHLPELYEPGQNLTLQPMVQAPNQINDLIAVPANMGPNSNQYPEDMYRDTVSKSVQASEGSISHRSTIYHSSLLNNDYNQVNQYNNFMNNDKLVMMQMQQPGNQRQQFYSSDYHQVPLYSNSEVLNTELVHQQLGAGPELPIKQPVNQYWQPGDVYVPVGDGNYHPESNLYANNEEIALQNMQYGYLAPTNLAPIEQFTFMRPTSRGTPHDEHDEFEYHHVDLERENTDSNWGIRLIGGAEVNRAISIGSMIFAGVAAKSGKLKSGDEIISIDGVNVIGATHKHVVDLISACTNRVSLVVRRKTFAEACDVVLTKNLDEGFGFVIISNENCALIGKIIEGSPADRCKQLRVRDCIIAVNGRYIAPDMKHPEIVNMIKDCGSTLRLRIIPVDCYTVKLIKDVQNDSFGFRMRGGSEYDGTPLYIVRVEPDGQAHGLLSVGDQILEINNIPTVGMTHQQAATIIKYSDPIVKLKLRRNHVTPPSLLVDSPRSLQNFNQTAEITKVNPATTPTNIPNANETPFTSFTSFTIVNCNQ